jgi:hypothetical protein
MRSRIELFAGLACVALVVTAVAVYAAMPWSSSETCIAGTGGAAEVCSTEHEYLWDQDVGGLALGALIVGTLSASIAGGAAWHASTGSHAGRTLLWSATGAAFVLTVISMASVGLIFAPATVCAIVASVAALSPSPDLRTRASGSRS